MRSLERVSAPLPVPTLEARARLRVEAPGHGPCSVFVSRDGALVAVHRGPLGLSVWDTRTGQIVWSAEDASDVSRGREDGMLLVVTSEGALQRVALATGRAHETLTVDDALLVHTAREVAGRVVVTTEDAGVLVLPHEEASARTLVDDAPWSAKLAAHPSGTFVVTETDERIVALDVSLASVDETELVALSGRAAERGWRAVISIDGTSALVAHDHELVLADLASGARRVLSRGHALTAIAWLGDDVLVARGDELVILGRDDGAVRSSARTTAGLAALDAHDGATVVASLDREGELVVWDVTLAPHDGARARDARWIERARVRFVDEELDEGRAEGRAVVSRWSLGPSAAVVWDVEAATRVGLLPRARGRLLSFGAEDASPDACVSGEILAMDERRVVVGSAESVSVVVRESGACVGSAHAHELEGGAVPLALSSDGAWLAWAFERTLVVARLESTTAPARLVLDACVTSVTLTQTGAALRVIVGLEDGRLEVRDVTTLAKIGPDVSLEAAVTALAIVGASWVAGTARGALVVGDWEGQLGATRRSEDVCEAPLDEVVASHDGLRVAIASREGRGVWIARTRDGALLGRWDAGIAPRGLAFTKDGAQLGLVEDVDELVVLDAR